MTTERAPDHGGDFPQGNETQSPAVQSGAVAWQWRHGDEMDWHTVGERPVWFDDEALNPRFRSRALGVLAAPQSEPGGAGIDLRALAHDLLSIAQANHPLSDREKGHLARWAEEVAALSGKERG